MITSNICLKALGFTDMATWYHQDSLFPQNYCNQIALKLPCKQDLSCSNEVKCFNICFTPYFHIWIHWPSFNCGNLTGCNSLMTHMYITFNVFRIKIRKCMFMQWGPKETLHDTHSSLCWFRSTRLAVRRMLRSYSVCFNLTKLLPAPSHIHQIRKNRASKNAKWNIMRPGEKKEQKYKILQSYNV